MCPGATLLAVQRPIGVGDVVRAQDSIRTLRVGVFGEIGRSVLASDHAIYDDMGDMHALRIEFPSEALRDCPQRSLGGGDITLGQYLACKHMLLTWRESGPGLIDDCLAKQGLRRNIFVVLPNFLPTPWILEKTDLLLCLPRRMAEEFVQLASLKILPVPIELPPYSLTMRWHPRHEMDRAHKWLRERLLDASASLESAPAGRRRVL